jgi:hypothetical protein
MIRTAIWCLAPFIAWALLAGRSGADSCPVTTPNGRGLPGKSPDGWVRTRLPSLSSSTTVRQYRLSSLIPCSTVETWGRIAFSSTGL